MVVDTLQLIHDGTDVLDTIAKLHTHSFLDDTYQRMTVGHGTEVIKTVGQCESLRIGHILHHFLNTTMDIAKMRIDALDGLTINDSLQAKHTMH